MVCEMRSRLLSKTLALGLDRTSGQGSVDSTPVPWSSGWRVESAPCPMRKIRTEGWTCHVSHGGAFCEVATCALRGGPYRYDFPSSLREKKSLKYFSMPTCLNSGGFWGFIRLGAGLVWAENLGLKNMAMEILSFAAFTVARCSMLVYTPLLRICKIGRRGSW